MRFRLWHALIILLLILMFAFRLSVVVLQLAMRFWYVAIPLFVILFWKSDKKKMHFENKGKYDPNKEIKTDARIIEEEDNKTFDKQ
ncbi:MAG: hypothetical protein PHR06_01870 [Candidatus Cloacimonetes bacterium]|nr:hypothetical protein [Candidatus Cloacimonadota bacterium]